MLCAQLFVTLQPSYEKGKMGRRRVKKLSRRITWRVIGIISFFNVMIIGAINAFLLGYSFYNGNMRGQYVVNGIGGNVQTLEKVVKATAFNNRAEIEANLESPEKVFDTLEDILLVNRQMVGCFAAFEPDYFEEQGRWFEANAYFSDSTHIVHRQLGTDQHDYFNKEWYQKAMALNHYDDGFLTDPYYDYSVDSTMYCSYVLPIFDSQGRKVGVYGLDLDMSWLDKAIDYQEKTIKEEFFDAPSLFDKSDKALFCILLLDSKGRFVAGTDSLDINLLRGEKKELLDMSMKDLVDTPYYINTKLLGNTGWTLAVIQHRNMVLMWGLLLAVLIVFVMCVGGIVIFCVTSWSIRRATLPLGFLSKSAHEVAKGNFNTLLPKFKHKDEVTQLRNSFAAMQVSLKQYVSELKESTAAKASMESELNIAHNIQMAMLPKSLPPLQRTDIELYASLTPAKAVGGDLYDFFMRDDKLYFCIGDVSGKGVPASLVMAVTRTLFRNIAAHTTEPRLIVDVMNKNICEGNDNNMFVTLFVGVLDLENGHLRYCNAGHNPPILNTQFLPVIANLPVGMMDEWEYQEQELMLDTNSILFLYTDGLTEAENATYELMGEQRVMDVVEEFFAKKPSPSDIGSSQELVEEMTDATHQFVGNHEQNDDLTMMAIKWKGEVIQNKDN